MTPVSPPYINMSKHAVQTWCGYSLKIYINALIPPSPKHSPVFRTSSVSESKDSRVGLFAKTFFFLNSKIKKTSWDVIQTLRSAQLCLRYVRAPRWWGKCACHRRGRAVRAKIPHNRHEIQTLHWFNSTKTVHIYLSLGWRILHLKNDKCDNNNKESNKSIGGIWGNLTESKRAELGRGDIQIHQTGTRVHKDV